MSQFLPNSYFKIWLNRFLLTNACLFWLLGIGYASWVFPSSYATYDGNLNIFISWVFVFVTWVGHFFLLAFLPGIILLPFVYLPISRRVLFSLAIIISSVDLFLLIIDFLIFNQYRFHLNGVVWSMLSSGLANSIFGFSFFEYLEVIVLGIIIIIGEWLLAIKTLPQSVRPIKKQIYYICANCLFFSYLMFLLSSTVQFGASIAQQPQAFPLYNFFLSKLLPVSNSEVNLEAVGKSLFRQPQKRSFSLAYPQHPLSCHPSSAPLNILMIVIDTWRFDMLTRAVTPNIYQFAKTGWQFTNHYSGGNATQPGIFSLFYALPGTYWDSFLAAKRGPLFIDELLKNQYQTQILASAPLTMPAFNETVFREIPNLKLTRVEADPKLRDESITREFIDSLPMLKKKKQPFFSFLFYDAVHSHCAITNFPAIFKPSLKTCNRLLLNKNTNPIFIKNHYKNALHFVDQLIGQVFTALKKNQLLKNTIVIITSDHGEEFNDNKMGYWSHASNFSRYQLQVPLIIYWPKEPTKIINDQTTHLDIVPTLLTKALKCNNPPNHYSLGQTLLRKREKTDYFLATSYISYGIIEPQQITTIYSTGTLDIQDQQAKPKINGRLNLKLLQRAFNDMYYFYKKDNL